MHNDGKSRHIVSNIGLEMGLSEDYYEAGKILTKWLFEQRIINIPDESRGLLLEKIQSGDFQPANEIYFNDEGKQFIMDNFGKNTKPIPML